MSGPNRKASDVEIKASRMGAFDAMPIRAGGQGKLPLISVPMRKPNHERSLHQPRHVLEPFESHCLYDERFFTVITDGSNVR